MVNGWLLFESPAPQKCVGVDDRKLLVAEPTPLEGAYGGAPAAVTASGDRLWDLGIDLNGALGEGLQRRKSALETGPEVIDILQPDMKPQRRPAGRPFRRRAVGIAVEGNDEAFETAPRKAHAEQFDGIEQGVDRLWRHRFQDNAEQAGGAGE